MIRFKYFFYLLIFFKTPAIFSQDQELDPVVVSGSLSAQKSRETGRNIIVIRQEEIRMLPANSLDEILKFIPGIEVQQRGPQGAQSDIVIRGGTFQQVLVVIDGIRINDPLTGHFNSYIPIHPNEIDRIEVLKGASSAIFGADAVGGVINIITKKFQQRYQQEGSSVQAKISAGSYGMLDRSMHIRLQGNKNYLSFGYQKQKADGPQLRGTTGYFDNENLVLSVGRILNNKWTLMARGAIDNRSFNAQNFYTTFKSDTANEKVNSTWQQLVLTKKSSQSTLEILAGTKQLLDIFYFRPNASPNRNKTGMFNFQVNNTMNINDKNTWTAGVQSFMKRIRSNDRGNHDHLHAGIFSVFTHRLPSKIILSESIRADWDKSYKWVMVPQINVAWSPGKTTLRSSVGKSIRDADFTERYNNYNKSLVTGGSIGNPNLKAEKAWNMELGFDYTLSSSIELRSTVFSRVQQELIDWSTTSYADMPRKVNLSPTGNYALASNISSVTTRGFEVDLAGVKVWNENKRIRWRTGLIYLNSVTPIGAAPSFYISSHAKWMWSNTVVWMMKNTSVSYSSLFKTRNPQKSASLGVEVTKQYFLHNLRIEKMFFKKKLGCFIQIDNLTNIRYSDLLGSRMPGRWWSGGAVIGLK